MTTETDDAQQGVAEAEPVTQPEEIASDAGAENQQETPPVADAAPAEDKPKKDPWWQKRIDEVTAKRYEADARATAAEQALADFIAQQRGPDPEPTTEGRVYTQAELDQLTQQRASQLAQQQTFTARCNTVAEEGSKTFGSEWDASLKNLTSVGVLSPQDTSFIEAALETDAPEKVLHHLGQDPDEAARVAALPPLKRAIEMDRIATRLNAKGAPEKRTAPPPVTPVDGSASPNFDPETASIAEFIKWREKKRA